MLDVPETKLKLLCNDCETLRCEQVTAIIIGNTVRCSGCGKLLEADTQVAVRELLVGE